MERKLCNAILFKAGKVYNGLFTNNNILNHAKIVMDMLKKHFPNEHHAFIFDNATTHLKQADDALSTCQMPKYPTKSKKLIFEVVRNVVDAMNSLFMVLILKEHVKMSNGKLPNGDPSPFTSDSVTFKD